MYNHINQCSGWHWLALVGNDHLLDELTTPQIIHV